VKPVPKSQLPRWVASTLFAITAVFLLGLFSTEFADTDAWWHLASGRYIVTQHRLPWPDPFAYTTAGAPPAYPGEDATRHFNLTHEWLAQAAMYVIYCVGGFNALVLWKALLLALLCLITGHIARLRTGSMLWGIAASLATASLAIEFAHDRPSILTYVFTAVFIAIFEEDRWHWLLPPLALLWANCHGGFFLGWIVCGAYAADALRHRRWRIIIISGAAVLVSLANPNGWSVLNTLFRYRQSAMQSTLIEWSRADLWGPPWVFVVLLYAAAIVLAISWRRVRLSDWLLFAAFAAAAISAFRNEMLIGLLAPVLIVSYLRWKHPLPPFVSYAVIAALAIAIAWGAERGSFFQFRVAEWRFPAGAEDFLARRRISVPLFNTYENGGYLIWRGQRVFIDGRALSESVFQDYRLIMGTAPADARRDQALARYGIGAIVLNGFEYNSGTLYPIVVALGDPSESEWKLAYDDAQALVFLRQLPPGVEALPKSRIVDHLEAECRLHVERDPEFSLCARTLADLFLKAGARDRARTMLSLYLEHPYAEDPEAQRTYRELLRR